MFRISIVMIALIPCFMSASDYIDQQKRIHIAAIESLCRGDLTFNDMTLSIADHERAKVKYEYPLTELQSVIIHALKKIKHTINSMSPAPAYYQDLFINKSLFIKKTEMVAQADDHVLIDTMEANLDHRLSFGYYQLYILSSAEESLSLAQIKARSALQIIMEKKPITGIRMLWIEQATPVDLQVFNERYETYCKHSISILKRKITENSTALKELQKNQEAQTTHEHNESWCSIL